MKAKLPTTSLLPLLCLSILTTSSCLDINVGVHTPTTSTNIFTIAHHKSVQLTESRVRAILDEISVALQNNPDSDEDYNCEINFNNFVIKEFDYEDTPATVTTQGDMELLAREPGQVKVVGAINWDCGTIHADGGELWGCSPTPGDYIVVQHEVDKDPALDGILWLHELGHNAGLSHVEISDAANRDYMPVMTEWVGKTHTMLNEQDCHQLRQL